MKIENMILLVLDIQERLMPVIKNNERIIKYTDILIKACKELNIPIIYTEQYPKGIGETVTEIKSSLLDANAKYFSKNCFSAYPIIEDELLKLKENGKTSIIVTGVETHICVYQTVRDLKEHFEVFVPFETVGSRSEENLKKMRENLHNIGFSYSYMI